MPLMPVNPNTTRARVMLEIAEQYAGGRLVSVMEGGYSLTGLASGVRSHVDALMGN